MGMTMTETLTIEAILAMDADEVARRMWCFKSTIND